MIPAFRKNEGFSLIELAILLTVIGLIGGSLMQEYGMWYQSKISGDNGSRQTLISNALSQFYTLYGRLPCPSDPSFGPNLPNAGYEVCPDQGNFGSSPPVPICVGKVCRVLGGKDGTEDGPMVGLNPTGDGFLDPVLVGSIPYAALGLTATDGTDAWGDKITYAVTEYLTNNDPNRSATCARCVYSDTETALTMRVYNQSTDSIVTSNAPGSYPLIFLSHGPDGKGAYSYAGVQNSPCAGVALDVENCNGDSTFLLFGPGIYSTVPGPKFFDDIYTITSIRKDSDKWASVSGGMTTKNGGKVGINALPTDALDVGGNVRTTGDAWANQYCSDVSGNCFTPSIIGGAPNDSDPSTSSAHCGTVSNPTFMIGINGTQPFKTDCASNILTTNITPGACASGQYMTGIDAAGNIKCVIP